MDNHEFKIGDVVVIQIPEGDDPYAYTTDHSWGVVLAVYSGEARQECIEVSWGALTGDHIHAKDRHANFDVEPQYLRHAHDLHPGLVGKTTEEKGRYLDTVTKILVPTAWIASEE